MATETFDEVKHMMIYDFFINSFFVFVIFVNIMMCFACCVHRPELCPEKRMLFYPKLPKIIGSDYLEDRIRSIHGSKETTSACHVFGHTHFCWDLVLDGIR